MAAGESAAHEAARQRELADELARRAGIATQMARTFDDAARRQVVRSLNNFPFNVPCRDFLTGFHKRKLQKKEEAKKKAKERVKSKKKGKAQELRCTRGEALMAR